MSYSETITRTDLTNILNEVLPPTPSEYRKLLWTNPNPTANFSAQTVSIDLSDYDGVDIELKSSATAGGGTYRLEIGGTGVGIMNSGIPANMRWRYFGVSSTGVQFSDGYQGSTVSNGLAIPYKIYGIKYERVNPPQEEIADYIVEQGTNTNGTYRKWNSGLAECWGIGQIGSNSACTVNYPMTFNTTSGMTLIASCEYSSSLTYVAPTISVQKYVDHANLYARVSTSTTPAGYYVDYYVKGTWK